MNLTDQTLIDFLKNTLNIEDQIDPETELFSSGLLDSVAMMNVIAFVEETGRIEVYPGDVTLDNFDSVERIVRYLEGQR
ncbi:acyl carrier protein [Sulfitobacter sp.]|uniref:acyl carrier protein n=1 Tax=Sulfitobacter sp. TaxID=1903071 RepID=UPI00300325F3